MLCVVLSPRCPRPARERAAAAAAPRRVGRAGDSILPHFIEARGDKGAMANSIQLDPPPPGLSPGETEIAHQKPSAGTDSPCWLRYPILPLKPDSTYGRAHRCLLLYSRPAVLVLFSLVAVGQTLRDGRHGARTSTLAPIDAVPDYVVLTFLFIFFFFDGDEKKNYHSSW